MLNRPLIRFFCLAFFLMNLVACSPETDPADPDFSGSWTCKETTSNPAGTSTFTVHLKKSGNEYLMENFYNLGFNYQAKLLFTDDNISIVQQNIGGFAITGSGNAKSSTSIVLSYTANDGSGSGSDVCSAELTKK